MKKTILILTALLFSVQAQAALVGTLGGKIIGAVSIQEDSPTNRRQQGFDEQQGVLLTKMIKVDGGFIAKGTKVDSHIIFFNTKGNKYGASKALWKFDGQILGVMSDKKGRLMNKTNDIFAAFDDYFTTGKSLPFNAAGMEGRDGYFINAMVLGVFMEVTEPGDWIRVITASAVPIPAAIWLFGSALLGFVGMRRRSK
ncbi:MAG: hypothetical protein COB23_05595 [Methylophaga sp.]|nr:MAG: hypothetical protein COB23_05595 [Methylophaga sp.]